MAQHSKYEAVVKMGNMSIMINANGVIYPANVTLSPSEHNGVALISEVLRRLRSDRPIEIDMPPTIMVAIDKLVMCEWLDSGTLKVHDKEPDRKWKHCDNEVQALAAQRSFTCNESLSKALPKKRTDTIKEIAMMQLGIKVDKPEKYDSDSNKQPLLKD